MAFPDGWGRKCELTIADAMSGGALADFPLLLTEDTLPSEMFDADGSNPALNGGGDIRFSSDESGTTQLACDVVFFTTDNDPANGTALVFVKVPSIAASAATTIWVWYDKTGESQPAVTDTYGRNAVWSDAQMACFMESTTAPVDRTGNHTLTLSGTLAAATGPWGSGAGLSFDGNDRLSNSDAALRDLPLGYDMTVSAVVQRASSINDVCVLSWDGTDDLNIYAVDNTSNTERARVFWRDLGGNITISASGATPAGQWNWVDFTTRGSNDHELYAAGASEATSTATGTAGPYTAFYIGGFGASLQDWDGDIASVVVWASARSATWVTAQYNNQFAPATYISAGTPEDAGGGGGGTPRKALALLGMGV